MSCRDFICTYLGLKHHLFVCRVVVVAPTSSGWCYSLQHSRMLQFIVRASTNYSGHVGAKNAKIQCQASNAVWSPRITCMDMQELLDRFSLSFPLFWTHTNLSVPIPIGLPVRFRLQSFVLLGSLAAIAFLQCSLQRTIIDNLYVAVIFLIDILVRCLYTGTIVVVGCLF
jgi:hypothetical protein